MQIEAGSAAAAAVFHMLAHVRRGVHYLFSGVPGRWWEAEFDGIRTEGGFLVGATRRDARTTEVRVTATRAGTFRLRNPWGDAEVAVHIGRRRSLLSGDVLSIEIPRGGPHAGCARGDLPCKHVIG
jgi:hypothetical protein